MKQTKNKPGFFDIVWAFFSSVRLTVATLLLLAVTSIIGTLIPQNQSIAFYSSKFGDGLFRLFSALTIFDMYHSWWFQFLILTLAVNIVICSLDRFGPIWKIVRKKPVFTPDRFKNSKIREQFTGAGSPDSVKERFTDIFSKKFKASVPETSENGFFLVAETGRWTRLGAYIVHLGVLLLLAGGLAGSLRGFEGTVKITEGETADTITLKKEHGHIQLDFSIRCDRFELSHYDNGAPKEYRSDLTIIENGNEVLKKSIIVNDPLRYKGINIFQSFFGSVPGDKVLLNFTGAESGMTYQKEAETGKSIELPEHFGTFVLMGFIPSYNFKGHNIGETLVGMITRSDGSKRDVILPLKHNQFDRMFKPDVAVSVEQFDKKFYTGLQITKDPGVYLVYTGFILMIIGCFITFYMSHRALFLEVVSSGANGHSATLYGTANKNRLGMKTRVKIISEALRGQSDR